MLDKSYAAVQQFQRQISEVGTFEEFKRLFQINKINLVLQVGSSTFWQMDWDPVKDTISGVLDLRIYPKIMMNQETYETRSSIAFRFEDPNEVDMRRLQDRLIDPIKKSLYGILIELRK